MDLILWRHAEAEDGFPDAGRELTEKGKRQAKKMAQWLEKRLPADCRVLASPAKRTQQTVKALSDRFETTDDVGTSTSAARALAAAGWPDAQGTVLLVGHQPTLGRIASRLLAGTEMEWGVKKGAIWWISYRDGGTVLRAVISPDLL